MTNPAPTPEPSRNWRLLGETVRTRRDRLGLTQDDISEAGGPSHQTLRRLEHGAPGPYRTATLNALEKTLQWQAGTINAILDGKPWQNPDDVVSERLSVIGAAIRSALPDMPTIDPEVATAISEAMSASGLAKTVSEIGKFGTAVSQAAERTAPERVKHPGINSQTVGADPIDTARQDAIRALLRFVTAVDENPANPKSRRVVHRNVLNMIGKLIDMPGDDS